MTGDKRPLIGPVELRRKAEELARENTARSTENIKAFSPEETERMIHELCVHQIELEMQNEELGRAQTELQTSHERFQDLYDFAPVGYCTASEQGMILEINLTAATLFGLVPRSQLVDKPLSRFILAEDQDIYYLHSKALFATGEPQECEVRIVRTDKSLFWARLETIAVMDADGITACRIVFSDMTERKLAEEALRNSERYLRSTVDGLTAHITVIDDRGEIILTNKAYRDFGTQNGIDPRTVSEGANYLAVCDTASGEHSEEAAPFAEGIREVLSGKCRSFKLEYPCHSLEEELWFSAHVTPFDDESPRQVIVAHQNITERKQAQEALRESEEKYRTVADFTYNMETWRTPDGMYRYVSPSCERITGHTTSEFLADPNLFIKITHPDDKSKIVEHFHLAINHGPIAQNMGIDFRIITPEGDIRWIGHLSTAVQGRDGRSLGRRESSRDITKRIRAEEEKEKAKEVLKKAHDTLEQRVRERTIELSQSNVALTVLLKKREKDREILAEQVVANVNHLVDPFFDRLNECKLTAQQQVLVDILRSNIKELAAPFANNFSTKLVQLTPMEIQVANLVKQGKRSKEIAEIMRLSPGTVNVHRKNIRKKLHITHQKTNLQTILSMHS